MMPPKLYHGTASRHVGAIKRHGIQPRLSGKGCWQSFPSIESHVYLTECYALHFAIAAMDEGFGDHPMLLEIDTGRLDHSLLRADEDAVAHALCRAEGRSIESVQDEAKAAAAKSGPEDAQHTLAVMGTCAYAGAIPVEAITRSCIIDHERHKAVLAQTDAVIAPLNYLFCGPFYRDLTAWCFGDRDTLPSLLPEGHLRPEQVEHLRAVSRDRDYITIEEGVLG